MSDKNTCVAYVLWFFLGFLGVHRFYLGDELNSVCDEFLDRPVSGVVWLLTCSICGIGNCK